MGRGTVKQVGPYCCTWSHRRRLCCCAQHSNTVCQFHKRTGLHAVSTNKLQHLAHIYCCATVLLTDRTTDCQLNDALSHSQIVTQPPAPPPLLYTYASEKKTHRKHKHQNFCQGLINSQLLQRFVQQADHFHAGECAAVSKPAKPGLSTMLTHSLILHIDCSRLSSGCHTQKQP